MKLFGYLTSELAWTKCSTIKKKTIFPCASVCRNEKKNQARKLIGVKKQNGEKSITASKQLQLPKVTK